MGVVQFLYHPDTVLTASYLEFLAVDLLSEIPIPGVESCILLSVCIASLQVPASKGSAAGVTGDAGT